MRKLASIKTIQEVRNIPESDNLEHYRVDDWWVVDTIGKYSVGERVVYYEIDSWIPHELAPFLSKGKEPRQFAGLCGAKGERLKTIKLRGAISQGLLQSIESITKEVVIDGHTYQFNNVMWEDEEDMTEVLGILKWERPDEPQLAGFARGNFPSRFQKTDETRIQSFKRTLEQFLEIHDDIWQVEEKLEGSSMTIGQDGEDTHVCSRNLSLKLDESNDDNTFVKVARKTGLVENLPEICKWLGCDVAFQGELIGPGIQDNIYKLTEHQWRIFNMFDVTRQQKINPIRRNYTIERINEKWGLNLVIAPIAHETISIRQLTVTELLKMADGDSALLNGRQREGLVFKSLDDPNFSFKAISDKYLLKQKD